MSALRIAVDQPAAPPPASREWIALEEAAPVLGVTVGQLRRRCARDLAQRCQAKQDRWGVDGRMSWRIHVSVDPALARLRTTEGEATGAQAASAGVVFAQATERQRADALRRARCVIAWRERLARPGFHTERDFAAFAADCERRFGLRPSRARIYGWNDRCPDSGDFLGCAAALLDRRGQSSGSGVSDDAWAFFEQLYLTPQQWSVAKCHRHVAGQATAQRWQWPSLRRVQELVKERIAPSVACYHRDGARAYQAKFAAPMEQDPEKCAAGEIWEADHSRLDFYSRVPDGRGGWKQHRLWLSAWFDVRSRRLMGWHIGESPNSDTARWSLLRALRDPRVSVPKYAWLDNGKDFDSRAVSGASKAQRRADDLAPADFLDRDHAMGLLPLLRIEPHFAIPYNHNGKARIERFFGTMHEDFCKGFKSYCGDRPDAVDPQHRQRILKDVMSLPAIEEVRERFDRWAQWYNHRSEHAIDDLADVDGRRLSPVEYYEAFLPAMRVFDRSILDLLEPRWANALKVGKRGIGVQFPGAARAVYFGDLCPELHPLVGTDRRVHVSYDPADTSSVAVYDEQMRFLCRAPENKRYGGVEGGPSVEDRREAMRIRREVKRGVASRETLTAAILTDAELADRARREREIAETRSRMRAAGIDIGDAPLRPVRTPLDGQADEVEKSRLRMAAGAEHRADDDEVDLSQLRLVRQERDDDDDDEVDLSAMEAGEEAEDEDEIELEGDAAADQDDDIDILAEMQP